MIRSFLRSLLQPFHKRRDAQDHLATDEAISLVHLLAGDYPWKPTNLHTITRDLMDAEDAARMQ